MEEQMIYIDCDGVILDSEERMLIRKELAGFPDHKNEQQFSDYFEYTKQHPEEWDKIIREAHSINESVEIRKKLEIFMKKIAILTKIHTLYEMQTKVDDLRIHRKLMIPIIFVPPGVKKHEVIIPNNNLLIDDSKKNIEEWIKNGGQGLLFDKTLKKDEIAKVRSLKLLLGGK